MHSSRQTLGGLSTTPSSYAYCHFYSCVLNTPMSSVEPGAARSNLRERGITSHSPKVNTIPSPPAVVRVG